MTDGAGLYNTLRKAIRDEDPVALATVIGGPALGEDGSTTDGVASGKKLLVRPDGTTLGDLGNEDLNRVVVRDSIGELSAGTSGVRH